MIPPRPFRLASGLLLLLATTAGAVEPVAQDAFVRQIKPLLEKHCLGCHGADAQEGGVSYAGIDEDQQALRRRPLWKRAAARLKAGEMPPEGEVPLRAADKATLVAWMSLASEYLDCSEDARDPGPGVIRRLNRTEYDLTIRELFGLPFESAAEVGMPDEAVVDGFDNTAAALGFSPALMEKYLAAADKVLERLYEPKNKKLVDALIFVRPNSEVTSDEAARQIATRLLRRAYRGPVLEEDLQPLLLLFKSALAKDEAFDLAVKAMIKPVLVSPKFLYRFEAGQLARPDALATRVTDHELAVRLSYFLWSAPPDEELLALAERNELSRPEILREQTRRLLADLRGRALTDNFAVQWLQLGKLAQARPTTEFFPTFTHSLRQAMRQETLLFFDHLRQQDRSILDLLDADYTFSNQELAKHYGLTTSPELKKNAFEQVSLRPGDHRGGILGMASVLTLTSHTFRTSPTNRGKYILEVVFGTPPPPPPANVGEIKDDNQQNRRAPASFRDLLAQHATQKSCAGCHKKLDPLGFALDNYDPIGGWRESRPEFPLDVTGELPTGEKFQGAAELKQLIVNRKDDFAKNLTGRLLSYALGRELDYFDDCTIQEVADRLKQNEYRFSELVLGIVESYPFQHRRVTEE